ncbi:replication protein A 70 kDa DNA-binding subunit A-like [Aristolochia californica]|uniref:replication protein A 70 kDa DNA-binding subunit A-like n=1 Tax=Aristolochia californica TaxID=171875 RepID=UPI0035D8F5CB
MAIRLTEDSIRRISEGELDVTPVLQVVDLRLVNTVHNTNERYRMVLSDGVSLQQAMLATQMNAVVKGGGLKKGSIIQLIEYICNVIQNRKIIIIMKLEVLVEECDFIGDPKPYAEGAPRSVPAASPGRPPLPAQPSSMDQSGRATGNQQSYSGPPVGGLSSGHHMVGGPPPTANVLPHGGSFAGPTSRRNMTNEAPPYFKAESGVGSPLSGNLPQNKGNYNPNLRNPGPAGGSRLPSNTYGQPAQSVYHQPSPMYSNRGPIAKNDAPARIIPIAALNPYQGRWTIRARVTAKGELRRYNNPRGEGKVFSFDLLDSDQGEIRVTCFNAVAEQFYDQIEVGKVYLVSKGSLKPAQKNFNHLNNEWEIFLESTSTIQPCIEEDHTIPRQNFNFRPIGDIESMETNSMVDVIGVVSSINPSSSIMRKNGTETLKRSLQLKDMSGRSVELTLWGNFCNAEGQELQTMCDSGNFPVLAVKAGRVNDFNGKSVGTISSSQLYINPDFQEARMLKEWFDKEGKHTASHSISRDSSGMGRVDIRKTVSQIKDEGLGRSEKPDWISVKASVSFAKTDKFCYEACPLQVGDRQCNKKVTNNGDGKWQCERCDQSFPQCDYRYLLQLQIQDHTGLTWVTAFQESGEEIMGISAKDLYLLKYEEQDDAKFGEIVRRVLFSQFLFKLKVKEEAFNDEQRVKITVVKAEKVNFLQESLYLLSLIEKSPMEDSVDIVGKGTPAASYSGMTNTGYSSIGMKQGQQHMGNTSGSVANCDRYAVASAKHVGQAGNPYSGVAGSGFGGARMSVQCGNCGSGNHNSQNCPHLMSGQGLHPVGGSYSCKPSYSNTVADGGGGGKCFKCNQSGHWARDCPGNTGVQSGYGSSIGGARYQAPKMEF